MSAKRKLTEEERIRFEEEERYLKASRGILDERLTTIRDELDSAQIQERQLKDQIETIGDQIKTQKENRSRQIALQLELNKSLSKTRDAFMKVVTESMGSGNLSQSEGLALIIDENIKEILTLDAMERPHANHRCRGLQNTCLSIASFFPHTPADARGPDENDNGDHVFSKCPRYENEGYCDDAECPHHQSGVQLEPWSDTNLPDTAALDEGEIPRRGQTISAWWINETGRVTLPYKSLPFSINTVICSIGLKVADNGRLLLENASSEGVSATLNVARYVDGFRLAFHAGTVTAPFDLKYLAAALEDVGFSASVVSRVKDCFATVVPLAYKPASDPYVANYEFQLELVKALYLLENGSPLIADNAEVDEASLNAFTASWRTRKERLDRISTMEARRIETLLVLAPICNVIKQCLEKAADRVNHGGSGLELTSLQERIEETLFALLEMTFDDAFSQLLIAPLFAGNIALACSLKLYRKGHSCLETLFNYGQDVGPEGGVNFFILSELLWSQLVQLRVCLPPTNMTSEQMADYKDFLVGHVDGLGIRLNHIKSVVGRVK